MEADSGGRPPGGLSHDAIERACGLGASGVKRRGPDRGAGGGGKDWTAPDRPGYHGAVMDATHETPTSDTVEVTFEAEGKTVRVPRGSNLRRVALANGIPIYGGINKVLNCLGKGLCGTDRVAIKPADGVSARSGWEEFHMSETPGIRLACRVSILGDIKVNTAPAAEFGRTRKEELKLAGLAAVPGILLLGGLVLIVLDFLGKF
jgi:ferredoxin